MKIEIKTNPPHVTFETFEVLPPEYVGQPVKEITFPEAKQMFFNIDLPENIKSMILGKYVVMNVNAQWSLHNPSNNFVINILTANVSTTIISQQIFYVKEED